MNNKELKPCVNGAKIITLCGSTRFKAEYEYINKELTLAGWIVLSCGVFKDKDIIDEEKKELDRLHLKKIDMSDAIFVIDQNEYIGESTKKEIYYAQQKNKEVFMFSLSQYKYYLPERPESAWEMFRRLDSHKFRRRLCKYYITEDEGNSLSWLLAEIEQQAIEIMQEIEKELIYTNGKETV